APTGGRFTKVRCAGSGWGPVQRPGSAEFLITITERPLMATRPAAAPGSSSLHRSRSLLKSMLLAPFLLFPLALLLLLLHMRVVLLEIAVPEGCEKANKQHGDQDEPEEDQVGDWPVSRGSPCPAVMAGLSKDRDLISAGAAADGPPKGCTAIGAPSGR